MPGAPPSIASIADVRRLSALPYERFMPHRRILEALQDVAARQPQRIALTGIELPDPDAAVRRWTYAQLVADVRRTANLYHALADGAPARVALLLPPMPQTHLALWAAETAGTACPINHQLDVDHLAALIDATQANILVALGPAPDLDIAPKAEVLAARCRGLRHLLHVPAGPGLPLAAGQRDLMAAIAAHDGARLDFAEPADALAALFHTGGTTGAPKLARHTHANQLHAAWGAACMFGTRADDVILSGFPLFHVAGSFVYGLSTLLAGGEIVLPTRLGLRNAEFMKRFGDFVERFGVTLIAGVPTVIAGLLALDLPSDKLRRVRVMLTGGSPLPDELADAFEARQGIPVRNILGMTESAGVISIEPLAAPRVHGSCGLPLPYTEVQVRRDDGTPAASGETGIVCVRGPQVSPGYTDAARDAGTFDGGWLVSGDIGHLDADGRVHVTGRAKDVIIRGAHNIDPGLIEGVLLGHPAVMVAAAVGEPDAYAGELPVAYVSLVPGQQATPEELAAFVAPRIAERPALPRRIEILPAIPMTAIGKVYKPALRVLATRHALQALLAARGLEARVRVEVGESAHGMQLCFTAADAQAEAELREAMKPFALRYDVRLENAR